jgi:lycopene beta-cyclase
MKHYDFIIAGGGLAGLSLACHLVRSPLRDRSILIVDKEAKDRNDRTWGFWTDQPLLFDDVVHHSWGQLQVVGEDFERVIDLNGDRYKMIRGVDLYRSARDELSACENVTFLRGVVRKIEDGDDKAHVTVDGQVFSGSWVFDSIFRSAEIKPDPARYHYLKLHFRGWEIETSRQAFNPQMATFLDFRTPQQNETRFFYVLPFSERRALVMYTLFSANLLRQAEYEWALKAYLETTLGIRGYRGIHDYRILREERGVIPITDQPFPRRAGRRIMAIGAKGGRIKPTTGYAFVRIQEDSAAIVQSLIQVGHPFNVPPDPGRYHLYDSILLEIMSRQGGRIKPIFTTMFKNNPIGRIFRFLDEVASPWENLLLIVSLPPPVFLQALFRSKVLRPLARPPW